MKHFKTLSLDESRSPDFDLFSDLEEYSEEEVVETMVETMEQYEQKLSRLWIGRAIPSKTVADAKVAIQEMIGYSQKWNNGTSRTRSTETSNRLAAKQAQLNNLGREIKKVNEKVYSAQVGCKQCKGEGCRATTSGFYQRNNANPSYQERRQSLEETLSKFMGESVKRHKENSNLIKENRASTDAAIRNQGASIKTLDIKIGKISKVLQERGFKSLPSSTETNSRDHVKSISIIVEADASSIRRIRSHQYAVSTGQNSTLMDHMDRNFWKLTHMELHISINPYPKRRKTQGVSLPCYINNVCYDNALADLGASVSVMPLSTYLNLGLGELTHTKLTVELADRTVKYPKGIAENVLVGIGKNFFPVDFIILDMPEDTKVPLILGRPFLSTTHAKIDVFKRKITLRVGEEKIIFKSIKLVSSLIKKVYMLSLRERMELDLEVMLIEETLVLNRSLDPFFGDYIELNDLNVPLELRRDQVDDLMPIIEEGEVVKEFRAKNDARMVSKNIGYLSDCDHDKKICIDCTHNLKFSCMIGSIRFFENKNDDAHEHVKRVLDIVSLFNIPGVSHDVVMLRVFPITLTGAAKRWVYRLPTRTVDSWDLLKKAFIQRYCPPSRTVKQLEEICNFEQERDETLSQAWERYNDLLPIPGMTHVQALTVIQTMAYRSQKWHDGSSSKSIESSINSEGITVIVNKLENLGRDMKKLKENVHAIQVGCQTYKGAHLDKDCPLNEEVKGMEEVKYGEFNRSFPNNKYDGLEGKVKTLANEVEGRANNKKFEECKTIYSENILPLYTPFCYSPEEIEYFSANLGFSDNKEQETDDSGMVEAAAALEATLKKKREEPKKVKHNVNYYVDPYKPLIPFPKRLEHNAEEALVHQTMESLNKIKINHPLLKEIRKTDNYAKQMKYLVENKPRTKEDKEIRINPRCSALLQNHLPPKEQDLGSFILPCSIGKLNFKNALADLGASFNVMPFSMYKCLGIGKLEPINMLIKMADNTKCVPKGIVKNLLIKIDKFIFLVDLVILDMVEDIMMPIILERPLLATAHAKVDIFRKTISLEGGSEKVILKM
nr:hypothetical protein [Tanacetum cinerariifolium]